MDDLEVKSEDSKPRQVTPTEIERKLVWMRGQRLRPLERRPEDSAGAVEGPAPRRPARGQLGRSAVALALSIGALAAAVSPAAVPPAAEARIDDGGLQDTSSSQHADSEDDFGSGRRATAREPIPNAAEYHHDRQPPPADDGSADAAETRRENHRLDLTGSADAGQQDPEPSPSPTPSAVSTDAGDPPVPHPTPSSDSQPPSEQPPSGDEGYTECKSEPPSCYHERKRAEPDPEPSPLPTPSVVSTDAGDPPVPHPTPSSDSQPPSEQPPSGDEGYTECKSEPPSCSQEELSTCSSEPPSCSQEQETDSSPEDGTKCQSEPPSCSQEEETDSSTSPPCDLGVPQDACATQQDGDDTSGDSGESAPNTQQGGDGSGSDSEESGSDCQGNVFKRKACEIAKRARDEVAKRARGVREFAASHADDIVHGALDVAGFVPVVGGAADLLNAGIYLAQGDRANAALAAVAAVPGVGDAAKAAVMAAKGAKLAKIERTTKAIDEKPVRRIYEHNPKHGREPYSDSRGRVVSRAPRGDCQAMLDCSVQLKRTSLARIGKEPSTGRNVIFRRGLRQELPAEIREYFHGFVP